ncbi:hypothetical protein C2845_PM05G11570 [Panicum miliaceum]|uniref:Uncharacterized protein n=1 Tax=Panicum miliaceum TaxID=4540 RepID=A0A3L6SZC2_PANMI|nr:hypothetical protein C2845_PM05G11570 [Panicum miliaceum]
MSPATSAAAVPVPGVLIRQPPSTLRPSPIARLLPSGAARPLQATSASRRLPASAVRAQSAADPGQEPLPSNKNYIFDASARFIPAQIEPGLSDCQLIALPRSVVFSGYLPESEFYKIEAILRFVRFTAVEGAARVLGECGSVVLGP